MTLLALFLTACTTTTGPKESVDSGPLGFCEKVSDGGSYEAADREGSASSGDLVVKMITVEDVDIRNPLYIAFKDYTLENTDTGGIQQTGQTSGDGIASITGLGPGNWSFQASFARGSRICTAVLSVPVAAGQRTTGCVVMSCPD
jgi:hypothetical protein